jgi:hypothetical protein
MFQLVSNVPLGTQRLVGGGGFRRKLRIWALKGVDLWSIVFANECYSTR